MKGPLFYSKILLFGEYGIIEDSKGLSIPYNFFNGALKISENHIPESKKSNLILLEFCEFLKERKKYWLLPVIIVLALFGALIVLSQGSAVAPFIYTIF